MRCSTKPTHRNESGSIACPVDAGERGLLPSRGAIFPALQSIGLDPAAVRRAWAALGYGAWTIATLLHIWRQHIEAERQWQAHQYEGYYAKAVDITAYWRPALKGCRTKHYHPQAGRALPAVTMGLIGRVGHLQGQRMAVLTDLVRSDPDDPREATLQARLLERTAETLAEDEMAVLDAGFKIRELHGAKLERWVVRLAKNFTVRLSSRRSRSTQHAYPIQRQGAQARIR